MTAEKMTANYTELLTVSSSPPVDRNMDNNTKYTEEMVDTSHGQVLVAWTGDRTKTPIVTYHDLGLNYISNFQAFFNYADMAELTKHFCVLHVNAPGQEQGALNLSPDQTYPTMDELGEQIQEVLNHFSLVKYIGVGVGLGANVLLRHALAYPERVDCLLLVNATSNQAGWIEWGYQKRNVRHLANYGITAAVMDYLMWHHFGSMVDQRAHDLVAMYRTYFENDINSANLGSLAEQYIARTDINLTRMGDTLKVPVLNIVGSMAPFIEETVTLNGRLEPSKTNWIKIADVAMVLDERPDKVCEAFRLFLQGQGYCLNIRKSSIA